MKEFLFEKKGFKIYLEELQEDIPIEDCVDIPEIIKQVNNDELNYFCARIIAEMLDLELGDSYSGCIIGELFSELQHKMADEAIINAEKKIKELSEQL